jgi:hypothetical protein
MNRVDFGRAWNLAMDPVSEWLRTQHEGASLGYTEN